MPRRKEDMSVLKRFQKKSEVEFLNTAHELEIFTIQATKQIPKTYTFTVIRKPSRKSITRNRQKLRKMADLLNNGEIKYGAIRSFFASQDGTLSHKNAYKTRNNMKLLHDELIIRRWHYVSDVEQRQCGH